MHASSSNKADEPARENDTNQLWALLISVNQCLLPPPISTGPSFNPNKWSCQLAQGTFTEKMSAVGNGQEIQLVYANTHIVHTFNFSTWKVDEDDLYESQASQGYVVKLCLKTKTTPPHTHTNTERHTLPLMAQCSLGFGTTHLSHLS